MHDPGAAACWTLLLPPALCPLEVLLLLDSCRLQQGRLATCTAMAQKGRGGGGRCRTAAVHTQGNMTAAMRLSCRSQLVLALLLSRGPAAVRAQTARAGYSGSCQEERWPDRDVEMQNHGICGDCRVLVTNFTDKYGTRCDRYCEAVSASMNMNMTCAGAWEDTDGPDTCHILANETCGQPFTSVNSTSDGICECRTPDWFDTGAQLNVGGLCDESLWPQLETGHFGGVCGECKVLVKNFEGVYNRTCSAYCEDVGRVTSMDMHCVGAWNNVVDESQRQTCRQGPTKHSCHYPLGALLSGDIGLLTVR
jgi:hypothetical protein